MKRFNILGYLLIAASTLLFFQCTSEGYVVAGEDGEDGIDGVDGVDGTASCTACHSNSHREPIIEAYDMSKHANQTIMFNGQTLAEFTNGISTSCVQCHTNEGYIEFQETGAVQAAAALPTRVDCMTCHSTHDTFDFENDGPDYALRNTDAVPLIVDDSYHLDFDNTSNNCISCHQPRASGPTDDGMGTFTITSTRWGPHHGPQSTMVEGMLGSLIPGSSDYPGIGSAAHRTGASCVSCHMGETTDGTDGSHTFAPTENACITCHTNGVPSEVNGLASSLATLEGLLENVVSQDGMVTGIVVDGSPQEGTFTITEAQAAWNYLYVLEDQSNGIHNPEYTKALINNAIEALEE